MADDYRVVTYTDELLTDGTVHRQYSNGSQEWRSRMSDGRVEWRDNKDQSGIDEMLGDGVLKRSYADGRIVYAREQGYGRTVWGSGRVVTINKSSIGGKVGATLAGLGAGALLGSMLLPPASLTLEEEEELRRRQQLAEQNRQAQTGQEREFEADYELGDDDDGSGFSFAGFDVDFGSDSDFG